MTAHTDSWKLRPTESLYIACEDMDFSWTRTEMRNVRKWWLAGYSLGDMAVRLDRDADEIAILLIHLGRQGLIASRPGSVWGTERSGG